MSVQASTCPFVTYRARIEFLTPVHVGSGRILDPFEYVTRREDSGTWLVIFDQAAVLADLPPNRRQEFLNLCNRDDFVGLRRLFQQEVKPEKHELWRIALDSRTFDEIQRNINNPNRMGEIHLFTRDPRTGRPYLPGSSIKGAIRTAIVDSYAQRLPDQRKKELCGLIRRPQTGSDRGEKSAWDAQRLEAELLGYAEDERTNRYRDPFRQLAITDASLPPEAMTIRRVQIVTRQNRSPGAEKILMYRDIVQPWLGKKPLTVEVEVRWHREFLTDVMGENRLPQKIGPLEICAACDAFYRPRWDEEVKKFPTGSAGVISDLPQQSETGCLLRLGRHSHFECMTLGPPFSQPPRRGAGKSRTRIDGTIPLGWIYLEFLDLKT
ncbi:MAG: type III-A CRISPR-associated RAMP protein Csm5 [Thermogutta sp.]